MVTIQTGSDEIYKVSPTVGYAWSKMKSLRMVLHAPREKVRVCLEKVYSMCT